ncbi:MAG: DUF3150 domain-containing protein [Syntrophobacteraceae bacterium]|jgi:hypothetical protein
MSDENIFQKACLVQLSTGCWQGMTALGSNLMERVGNADWLKGAKVLIDPDCLSPVRAVLSKARTHLQKAALPFPIHGLTLVPKETLSKIDEALNQMRSEFETEVEKFIESYEQEREKARESLGHLFNEADYPIDVRRKFRFEWRFITMDVPGKSGILSPELYQREKDKFQTLMEETRELATVALREEFAGIVRHMVERLSGEEDGKPKRFQSSMLEKMGEFLDSFGDRNLFNDEKLAELVYQARDVVNGLSTDELRQDANLRKYIADEMNQLRVQVDGALEDLPRRKIRLAA